MITDIQCDQRIPMTNATERLDALPSHLAESTLGLFLALQAIAHEIAALRATIEQKGIKP